MLRLTKRRYLAVLVESEVLPSKKEILETFWESVTQLYGEYGASHAGVVLIDFDESNKIAVVRVNLPSLENVRAAIATTTKINNEPAALHVLQVSGTIKSLREKIKKMTNLN